MESIIKRKRLEKNMTLEEVGNLVGVGKSTVRKWENGMIENMGRDKIVRLSKALNISPLEILGMDESELPPSSIETIYNQLNESRQTKVYSFAKQQLKEQEQEQKELEVLDAELMELSGEVIEKYGLDALKNIMKIVESEELEHDDSNSSAS